MSLLDQTFGIRARCTDLSYATHFASLLVHLAVEATARDFEEVATSLKRIGFLISALGFVSSFVLALIPCYGKLLGVCSLPELFLRLPRWPGNFSSVSNTMRLRLSENVACNL